MPASIASRTPRSVTSCPLTRMRPESRGSIPKRERASSVRPDPSRPVMPRISPGLTLRDASAKAPLTVAPSTWRTGASSIVPGR